MTRKIAPWTSLATLSMAIFAGSFAGSAENQQQSPRQEEANPAIGKLPSVGVLLGLDALDEAVRDSSLKAVQHNWNLALAPMILEMLYLLDFQDPDMPRKLWRLLEEKTGQDLRRRPFTWLQWLWQQEFQTHPAYPLFKRELYSGIDQRFTWWFYDGMPHNIRLEEVLWGGVRVDGIPPLEHPQHVGADQADYLKDDHVVFGVYLDGEARAYPKRILTWHELFNDNVGGVDVTCAYCTLCGAAVLYRQQAGGFTSSFGTSGFLYRSNKLMYDRRTRSLWSALEGIPLTGKLADSGLRLERLPIITTTWGEWRRRHPDTTVLSIETGYDRDYGEGVAYREYFATDQIMFPVPQRQGKSRRLRNKQEIVVPDLSVQADGHPPAAFAVDFLKKNPLHSDTLGKRPIVLLTDRSGATRVYASGPRRFTSWDRDSQVTDSEGLVWTVTEDALRSPSGEELTRIPSHRAFWFGWQAQFPDTKLVR